MPSKIDPRVEAAKSWSESARRAAREAFAKATAAGASRDEAIEAGHEAGLRAHLRGKELSAPAGELVARAAELFGAKVVGVVEPGSHPPIFDRCFEMFFPEPEEPAESPRSATSDDDNKTQEATKPREALAGELAKKPSRQGLIDFNQRTA
jgi:hypothetical protein